MSTKEIMNPATQIKMLCARNDTSKAELAKQLGFPNQYLYVMGDNFKKIGSIPDVRNLLPICERFNIALDDFLFNDFRTHEPQYITYGPRRDFGEQMRQLCRRNGVTIFNALTDIGLNAGYVKQLKTKGVLPRVTTAIDIAEYFGVTLHDLFYTEVK